MEELLDYVFGALEARGIDYVLSGSVAMNLYSTPRFTRDADIVIELREENFATFSEIFANRANYFHPESAVVEVRRQGMFNVIDWESGFKIDFVIKRSDPFTNSEFGRRQRHLLFGRIPCWAISTEDLILAKLIWIQDIQSSQQLIDIQNLLIENPEVDRQYIDNWVNTLQLNTFNSL